MSKLYIKVVVLDIWRGGWGWQGEVELGYQKNRRKEMINMNMRNGTLDSGALLDTNLDTTFLKVVAVISMLLDHVGGTFFLNILCSGGSGGWRFLYFVTV